MPRSLGSAEFELASLRLGESGVIDDNDNSTEDQHAGEAPAVPTGVVSSDAPAGDETIHGGPGADDAADKLSVEAAVDQGVIEEGTEDDDVPSRGPVELNDEPAPGPTGDRHWYILKVQSNREDSIREALLRRIKVEGLEGYFGDIIVPTEMVTEFKNGKKRVFKRKIYPGYIVAHMELNDDTWYMVRDTHGIGDFTGSGGKPSPMLPSDVAKIVVKQEEKPDEAPKLKISFRQGDRVKITEGTFENFEGDVDAIDEANGRVTVMINIFGRSTPVELEYWQVEAL